MKIVILILVALYLNGCSALISVGDNNTNTHTFTKEIKWKLEKF